MNEPYEGPLAFFSFEELTYLRNEVRLSIPKTPDEVGLKASILDKLNRVFTSDPRFRLPHQ